MSVSPKTLSVHTPHTHTHTHTHIYTWEETNTYPVPHYQFLSIYQTCTFRTFMLWTHSNTLTSSALHVAPTLCLSHLLFLHLCSPSLPVSLSLSLTLLLFFLSLSSSEEGHFC